MDEYLISILYPSTRTVYESDSFHLDSLRDLDRPKGPEYGKPGVDLLVVYDPSDSKQYWLYVGAGWIAGNQTETITNIDIDRYSKPSLCNVECGKLQRLLDYT